MKLSPEERIVLLLSRPHPTPKCRDAAAAILNQAGDSFDFEAMARIADANQVALYVLKNLELIHQLPVPVQSKMKNWYLLNLKRNMMQLRQALGVVDILKDQGVDAIPLKGALGLEFLCEDPGLYPLSDIDVLIRASDLEKAKDALLKGGYRINSDFECDMMKEHYHISMTGDPYVVELHWNLVKNHFDVSSGFWWEDTIELEYNGKRFIRLSWEKYLLYLMFRLYSNRFYPLKLFLFIVVIIGNKGSEIDWDRLSSLAKQLKMQRLAGFLFTFMHDLFDIPIPQKSIPGSFPGSGYIRNKILSGFFLNDSRTYLNRVVYLCLLDSPLQIVRQLLKSVFPTLAKVRLRYNIPRGSLKVLPYYLLNPFLMFFKKTKR